MTTADERYRALKAGRKLLEELCDPGKTPRVPSIVRDRARSALRHFLLEYEIEILAERNPEILTSEPFSVYNNKQVANKK